MILMYHKVDIITPTIWWVMPEDFERQLTELEGRDFVYLDDYDDPEAQAVITFDDAYENVFRHAFPILQKRNIPFEVFVLGDFISGWNRFDPSEPLTRHMGLDQLLEMAEQGGRMQWHSRSHPDLTKCDDSEILQELTIPDALKSRFPSPHMRWFSYPGGAHDERSEGVAKELFEGAVSVIDGRPGDRWQLNRVTVDQFTCFVPSTS